MAGCLSKQGMNSNHSNKYKFVLMLDESMDEREIQTHLAKGDADALIVQIAVDSSVIHVRSERRNMLPVCNIRWLQNALGPQYVICYDLLMLLLDATSSHTYFVIGKV